MTTEITGHRSALDVGGRLALGFIAACVAAGCRDQPPRPTAESAPPVAASSPAAAASASSAVPSAPPASPASPVLPAPSARPLTEKEKQALATYKAALARGRLATKKQDFKAAIQAFSEAIAADPSDARALAERGFAHLTAGDSDAADGDFDAALAGAGDPSCAPRYGSTSDSCATGRATPRRPGSLTPTRTCSSPRRRRAASSPADRRAPWRSARPTSRAPGSVKGGPSSSRG